DQVEIRYRQQGEEDQRIEDEQDADARVTSGRVRNGGGEQGDAETEIHELLDFRRDPRDEKRRDSQYLGDRQLHLEVIGQAQMNEASFREREVVEHGEVEDAEDHHGTDNPRRGPIDDPVSLRHGWFPPQSAIPMVRWSVSGCPSTRSMRCATSAREMKKPRRRFCPYAMR